MGESLLKFWIRRAAMVGVADGGTTGERLSV